MTDVGAFWFSRDGGNVTKSSVIVMAYCLPLMRAGATSGGPIASGEGGSELLLTEHITICGVRDQDLKGRRRRTGTVLYSVTKHDAGDEEKTLN